MNKKILSSILIAAGVIVFSTDLQAQQASKPESTVPVVISIKNGSFSMSLKNKGLSVTDISNNLRAMLGLSTKHTFVKASEKKDKIGFTHITYQQYFDNILVDGGKVLVHFKNGVANSINGYVAPIGTMSTQLVIPAEKALEIAKAELGVVSLLKNYPADVVIAVLPRKSGDSYALTHKIRIEGKKVNKTITKMEVYVDAVTGNVIKKVNLVHAGDVSASANTLYSGVRQITADNTAPSEYILRDNARNISTLDFSKGVFNNNGIDNLLEFKNNSTTWGQVPSLDSVSLLYAADPSLFPNGNNWIPGMVILGDDLDADFPEQGPIVDVQNSSAAPVTFPNIGYNLLNPPYTVGITSFQYPSFNNSGEAFFTINAPDITLGTHTWLDTTGNSGTYTINMQANPALDVHWGMEQTYDYYKNKLDRISYDDNGGEITNLVNAAYAFTGSQSQAAAIGEGYMVYGLGDRTSGNAFVSIDVTGHEFTHLVTENNGNGGLDYEGESGALNESFSDIFGVAIEFYAKGQDANWDMGEGILLEAPGIIRSMSDPKVMNNPDTYEGQYWVDPESNFDNGGVHYNSGVQNKWFYLLCEGGTGTNDKGNSYNVAAIGMEKAELIAYRNLTQYITPTATYEGAYEGALQATEDLYGDTSAEYEAVKEAWYAVGIGTKDAPTAVNDISLSESDIKIYPNPASGSISIASDLDKTISATIVNVLGSAVMKITISKGVNPVDISTLAKGIYLVRYETGAQPLVQKLSVL